MWNMQHVIVICLAAMILVANVAVGKGGEGVTPGGTEPARTQQAEQKKGGDGAMPGGTVSANQNTSTDPKVITKGIATQQAEEKAIEKAIAAATENATQRANERSEDPAKFHEEQMCYSEYESKFEILDDLKGQLRDSALDSSDLTFDEKEFSTFEQNLQTVKHGAKVGPIPYGSLSQLKNVATNWFSSVHAFTKTFGETLEETLNTLKTKLAKYNEKKDTEDSEKYKADINQVKEETGNSDETSDDKKDNNGKKDTKGSDKNKTATQKGKKDTKGSDENKAATKKGNKGNKGKTGEPAGSGAMGKSTTVATDKSVEKNNADTSVVDSSETLIGINDIQVSFKKFVSYWAEETKNTHIATRKLDDFQQLVVLINSFQKFINMEKAFDMEKNKKEQQIVDLNKEVGSFESHWGNLKKKTVDHPKKDVVKDLFAKIQQIVADEDGKDGTVLKDGVILFMFKTQNQSNSDYPSVDADELVEILRHYEGEDVNGRYKFDIRQLGEKVLFLVANGKAHTLIPPLPQTTLKLRVTAKRPAVPSCATDDIPTGDAKTPSGCFSCLHSLCKKTPKAEDKKDQSGETASTSNGENTDSGVQGARTLTSSPSPNTNDTSQTAQPANSPTYKASISVEGKEAASKQDARTKPPSNGNNTSQTTNATISLKDKCASVKSAQYQNHALILEVDVQPNCRPPASNNITPKDSAANITTSQGVRGGD